MTTEALGYFFTDSENPLEKRSFEIDDPAEDEAVVEVAGCGLCHTDITFFTGSVKTNTSPPLVLGHEISGTVKTAGESCDHLVGKDVIIPAVLPCGECDFCSSGRNNICREQKMPGNDLNGGFASHIKVPGSFLCELPDDKSGMELSDFSVIADAVTTPYQSVKRSGLRKGDLAVVIGVGGIGVYMVQIAKDFGATVIAADIKEDRLEVARENGADYIINSGDLSSRDLKKKVRGIVKENNLPQHRWKIFESSGTADGQEMAFSLLSYAGTVAVVGFTMDKVEIRLSNVMAFDADIFGNWGCKPSHYPDVAKKVIEGDINIKDNIENYSLDDINEVIDKALNHELDKRAVLIPE